MIDEPPLEDEQAGNALLPELDSPQVPALSPDLLAADEQRTSSPVRRPDLTPLDDVPITLEAVLGHCRLTIDELLALRAGSVVEVDRRVGEPIDLVVGGRLIGRGELILVEGLIGMTLTELVKAEAL